MSVTPRVFWAVTAVITEVPKQPCAANAFRSAWMPPRPPESEPAIVKVTGGVMPLPSFHYPDRCLRLRVGAPRPRPPGRWPASPPPSPPLRPPPRGGRLPPARGTRSRPVPAPAARRVDTAPPARWSPTPGRNRAWKRWRTPATRSHSPQWSVASARSGCGRNGRPANRRRLPVDRALPDAPRSRPTGPVRPPPAVRPPAPAPPAAAGPAPPAPPAADPFPGAAPTGHLRPPPPPPPPATG